MKETALVHKFVCTYMCFLREFICNCVHASQSKVAVCAENPMITVLLPLGKLPLEMLTSRV